MCLMRKSFTPAVIVLFLVAVLLPASRSWGWIDCGHRLVALVAWEDLTPKTKAAVVAILKEHARYKEDLLLHLPADSSPEQVDKYAFVTAATWPDMVRSINNPMSTLYNHPSWHYIDIPIVEDGVTVPVDKNAGGPAPHNAIEAIAQSKAQVVDDKMKPNDRAVALCYLEHCIGDIHQPLHCASLFSNQFPDGDQGGNKETLMKEPPYANTAMKLHLMWDSMPGDYQNETSDEYIAAGVRNDPRYTREKFKDLLNVTDPMDWAKEGHDLAWKYVYLEGKLQLKPSGEKTSTGRTQQAGVPAGYIVNGESLAMHQIALGGYRLADFLNGLFDPK